MAKVSGFESQSILAVCERVLCRVRLFDRQSEPCTRLDFATNGLNRENQRGVGIPRTGTQHSSRGGYHETSPICIGGASAGRVISTR